eukprot:1076059-Rhodomonas_salina.2
MVLPAAQGEEGQAWDRRSAPWRAVTGAAVLTFATFAMIYCQLTSTASTYGLSTCSQWTNASGSGRW